MIFDLRKLAYLGSLAMLASALTACGGGSGGSSTTGTGSGGTGGTADNVAQLVVDAGPANNAADQAFTSVTICVPGTSSCQTIDHVEVDTGSSGLRILSSLLTIALPQSATIAECTQFADMTFLWGPTAAADIKIAGESAASVPIQLINGQFQSIPASCSGSGGTNINDVPALGANGILGVGMFRQDCGLGCAPPDAPSGVYYSCTSGACQPTSQALAAQLQNPVWMFSGDNNGVLIQLNALAANGQATGTGFLIFGIGTQSNNALGSASPLQVDSNGNFSANFKGTSFTGSSFIDSGSNGFFFLDSATLTNQFSVSMPDCPQSGNAKGYYCPAATTPFSVTVVGNTLADTPIGATHVVNYNIANASLLFNSNFSAFDSIGGAGSPGSFDFGLPFFFGKSVFTAIEGQNTPIGSGPYFAF